MGTRLYLGNLSFSSTEESIADAFAQNSLTVSSVSVVTDRETGRSRGFAFVEMANDADAQAAIETMDGKEVDGRQLRVSEARERRNDGPAGGRQRGNW